MDEARIKALYRRHTAPAAPLPASAADDIVGLLQGSAGSEHADSALDRVAGSSLEADIARIVAGLEQDMAALSRDVQAVRRPRSRSFRRSLAWGGPALAASVAVLAMLLLMPQRDLQAPGLPEPASGLGQELVELSFEATEMEAVALEMPADAQIFGGDFDS